APRSVYGRTKLQGEQAIRASGCRHLILRTSWVFAARGANFAKTMVRLAREREQLRVVADQVGAPTSAELLADVSALALHRLLREPGLARDNAGLYHLASSGSTSWHAYACHVLRHVAARGMELRCGADGVQPIATSEYPTPAARPADSRLDCSALEQWLGIRLPPWQPQVERMLDEAYDLHAPGC
ncbi:MAG: sugar nucleotide-binding protein, partial [Betaproteobacteria bacterium]|nr:sugar nucleotide-binding protein [Betaproteobacteria bacterium]